MIRPACRIKPADCLFAMYEDLRMAAPKVHCWNVASLEAWFSAAADVLAQCPDQYQRVAWALELCRALPLHGAPIQMALTEVLRRAELTNQEDSPCDL